MSIAPTMSASRPRSALFQRLRSFAHDDCGAITIDWVVLSAAIIGLAIAAIAQVQTGTSSVGSLVSTTLTDAEVAALGCLGDGGSGAGGSGAGCTAPTPPALAP